MTLGSNIKKIRTEAQMSQEDFAELFDVSRQTISNWENEKSYPDLKTIVMLSDRFDVSLDVLLKEDMVMVETFDNEMRSTRKYARGFLAVALVLALCIGGFGIYAGVYAHTKDTLESNFAAQLQAHDFYRNSEGYYSMAAGDGVVFSVPNQSMPGLLDFSLHFHVSNLYCTVDRGETYVDLVWGGENDFSASAVAKSTHKVVGSTADFTAEDFADMDKLGAALGVPAEEMAEIVAEGNVLYWDFYGAQ